MPVDMTKITLLSLAAGAALVTGSAPASAWAQDSSAPDETVIGTPALQNFDLRGETVVPDRPGPVDPEAEPAPRTPAPQVQVPARPQQQPQQQQQSAPVRLNPAAPPVTRSGDSAATRPAGQSAAVPEARGQAASAVERAPSFPTEALPETSQSTILPEMSSPAPAAMSPPAPAAIATDGDAAFGGGWPIWPLAGGLLALLAAAYAMSRRRSAAAANVPMRRAATATPTPIPPPLPVPQPGPIPIAPVARPRVPQGPRAEVELTFEPTSTVIGDKEAIVHFLLTVHNKGALEARNVRLEARLFNAGRQVDADIGAFFSAPLQRRVVQLPQSLSNGQHFGIQGEVPLALAEIKPLVTGGRQLFIPMVAVTAIYDWEGGTGQTSKSYLVGMEANAGSKMGPFRLDQGPRVYRQVGQREHRLAHSA